MSVPVDVRKLTTVIIRASSVLVIAFLLIGCTSQAPPEPTTDIGATVQSAVEKAFPTPTNTPEPDFQATVHAGIAGTMEVMARVPSPTHAPTPTAPPTEVPTDTPTPQPTHTTTPIPTDTSTPEPTATSLPTATPVPTATHTPSPAPTPIPKPDIADVVERIRKGVVQILGSTGSGSGFIIDSDGFILTNEHVVSGQSSLIVVLDGGTRLSARIISTDASRDIALLKVETTRQLTVLKFATNVREGEEVVALGHPLNLGSSMTVTKGIISAFRSTNGISFIQTDAAINPGNSGGPLLNVQGEVVGMNTSAQREIEGIEYTAQGIGFAIRYDTLTSRITAMRSGNIPIATPTPNAVDTHTPRYVFGPKSGWLDRDSEDGWYFDSQIDEDHFIAELTLKTPGVIPGDYWYAGILVESTNDTADVVGIYESGNWYHANHNGTDWQSIDNGSSHKINRGVNAVNRIRLVVIRNSGWLFVNDAFMTELDFDNRSSFVRLYAFLDGDQGVLRTRFSDFTVRSVQRVYGPRSGQIQHDTLSTGLIDVHQTGTSMTDGIIEAEFTNPYTLSGGHWSNGFLFRKPGTDIFHAIVFQENRRWHHDLRLGDGDDTHSLIEQQSNLISNNAFANNHLRIIALGNKGWVFINGVYVDELDLSGLVGPGHVSAITNYFTGDGTEGSSTPFRNFTIWSAD